MKLPKLPSWILFRLLVGFSLYRPFVFDCMRHVWEESGWVGIDTPFWTSQKNYISIYQLIQDYNYIVSLIIWRILLLFNVYIWSIILLAITNMSCLEILHPSRSLRVMTEIDTAEPIYTNQDTSSIPSPYLTSRVNSCSCFLPVISASAQCLKRFLAKDGLQTDQRTNFVPSTWKQVASLVKFHHLGTRNR